MKNFLTLLIVVITYTAISFSQDIPSSIAPLYNGPNWGTITDSGITCTGGPGTSIIRDDNSYENGYRTVATGDSTTFVQLMRLPSTPMNLTNFCVTFTALSPSGNLPVDIIIYDTLGSGGTQPGSVVYRSNNHVCNSVALYPAHSRYGFPITFNATMKAYYVGVRWNNNPILPFFISSDENGTSGGPGFVRMTTGYPPAWTTCISQWAAFKNFGIRLEGTTAPPPGPQTTICRNGLNITIPDNTTIFDSVNVVLGNGCTITDVNVRIDTV
ncbi:MAG: hypothetical protein IT280_04930, partial [Ignavibacteria bacterium]|nr:hypothetical protein [Ignavibacteria bacterium]